MIHHVGNHIEECLHHGAHLGAVLATGCHRGL
jgi:hypothetical protein